MKTPQQWMESKDAGKRHFVLMSRQDILKNQEDAVMDSGIRRVTLGRKVDRLKSNWYVWGCDAILNNGAVVPGFIQGDISGNCVDFSSFEREES